MHECDGPVVPPSSPHPSFHGDDRRIDARRRTLPPRVYSRAGARLLPRPTTHRGDADLRVRRRGRGGPRAARARRQRRSSTPPCGGGGGGGGGTAAAASASRLRRRNRPPSIDRRGTASHRPSASHPRRRRAGGASLRRSPPPGPGRGGGGGGGSLGCGSPAPSFPGAPSFGEDAPAGPTSDISKGASDDRFIGSPQDVKISQYFGSGEEFANERLRKFHKEAVKISQYSSGTKCRCWI